LPKLSHNNASVTTLLPPRRKTPPTKPQPGFSQGQQQGDIIPAALAAGGEGDSKSQGRERQAHGILKDHPELLGSGPAPAQG
jgi:hypothetical protein